MREFLTYLDGAPQYILFGSMGVAIVTVCALEGWPEKHRGKRYQIWLSWLFLIACYCACVGLAAWLLVFFLGFGAWIAFLLGLVLGVILFIVAIQMASV